MRRFGLGPVGPPPPRPPRRPPPCAPLAAVAPRRPPCASRPGSSAAAPRSPGPRGRRPGHCRNPGDARYGAAAHPPEGSPHRAGTRRALPAGDTRPPVAAAETAQPPECHPGRAVAAFADVRSCFQLLLEQALEPEGGGPHSVRVRTSGPRTAPPGLRPKWPYCTEDEDVPYVTAVPGFLHRRQSTQHRAVINRASPANTGHSARRSLGKTASIHDRGTKEPPERWLWATPHQPLATLCDHIHQVAPCSKRAHGISSRCIGSIHRDDMPPGRGGSRA
jgi:hypothetical protein